MSKAQQDIRRKKGALEHAARVGNIRKTCRYFGIPRSLFYVWKAAYERASTLLASNRPVDDWAKLLGDTPAVTAMLDRLLHHGHLLKCGPRSWRIKEHGALHKEENQS